MPREEITQKLIESLPPHKREAALAKLKRCKEVNDRCKLHDARLQSILVHTKRYGDEAYD